MKLKSCWKYSKRPKKTPHRIIGAWLEPSEANNNPAQQQPEVSIRGMMAANPVWPSDI